VLLSSAVGDCRTGCGDDRSSSPEVSLSGQGSGHTTITTATATATASPDTAAADTPGACRGFGNVVLFRSAIGDLAVFAFAAWCAWQETASSEVATACNGVGAFAFAGWCA
jgi:hypothetical protein